jgi:hypothetical protein
VVAAQSIICVPVDDGAIACAFEQLDAQMDAWLAAMQRLSANPTTPSVTEAGATTVAPSMPCVESIPTPTPAPVPAKPKPSSARGPTVQASAAACASDTIVEPAAPPVTAPVERIEPAAQPESAGDAESDDETLLASLDAETAKAIRFMRRLGSGRKSVRELLAEYQARSGKQQVTVETAKKSWWRS